MNPCNLFSSTITFCISFLLQREKKSRVLRKHLSVLSVQAKGENLHGMFQTKNKNCFYVEFYFSLCQFFIAQLSFATKKRASPNECARVPLCTELAMATKTKNLWQS